MRSNRRLRLHRKSANEQLQAAKKRKDQKLISKAEDEIGAAKVMQRMNRKKGYYPSKHKRRKPYPY